MQGKSISKTGDSLEKGKVRLGIVVSHFNVEMTSQMVSEAVRLAKLKGANVAHILEVPGAFEIPFAADRLLSRKDVDAVATIGAVIKGDTKHDEAITCAICSKLLEISISRKKPIGLGIIGPGATYAKAKARTKEYARRSVEAALWMARLGV
ncbi:MAG: 6,7-dimethyl-8-ribityllumazine synthase [Candidatus Micrarchaeota archaeon]|nr:6,7-dimethyl-8-ribityllumazine synthase [Candidatus Micrarchaeota archaeon]